MWEEFVKKKIIVTPFDTDDGSIGGYRVIEYIVLRVLNIRLNTLAYVLTGEGEFEWVYPAEYTVLEEQEISNPSDAWAEHIGQRLLVRKMHRGEPLGEPREWVIVRTKDSYVMIVDLSMHRTDGGRYMPVWRSTSDEEILGVL